MDVAQLEKIDAFSGLPQDCLEVLARNAQEASYDEGDVLLELDAHADQLLGVLDGTVEVRRHEETLAKLGAGDIVGERGLVRHSLRNATVVAASPVGVVAIAHSDITRIRREQPEFDKRLQNLLDERED